MQIDLDRRGPQPLYRQIADQLRAAIDDGRIAPGSRLPTIRALAEAQAVTRVTIQKAYDWLARRGWLESTVGRGTFVCHQLPHRPPPTDGVPASAGEVLAGMQWAAGQAGLTSMALAEGDLAFAPSREFARTLSAAAARSDRLLGYGLPEGDFYLRAQVARILQKSRQAAVRAEEVLVTGGSSAALSLVTDYLCQPGDTVIAEDPTYVGALGLFLSRRLRVRGLPITSDGVDLDRLKTLLQRERPRFVYVMPAFQNPTGRCMSLEERRGLRAISARHDLPIVEDDTFGFLPLNSSAPGLLRDEDPGRVFHVGGLSKALFPGLRIGWLIPPATAAAELLEYHRATHLCGPPLLERAVGHFLEDGYFEKHLERVLPIYRRRRDTLVTSVGRELGPTFECSIPEGGYCCWVKTPAPLSEARLVQDVLDRGVAIAPGSAFRIEPAAGLEFRLCYGNLSRRRIEHAVRILARTIRQLPEVKQSRPARDPVYV